MDDTRAILATTERLYAAALALEGWAPALAGVGQLLRAGHTIQMASAPANGARTLVASAGVDERDLAVSAAATAQSRTNPLDLATLPPGRPLLRSALIPDQVYVRSEAYNEVTRRLNGWHAILAVQRRAAAAYHLAVCRPPSAADFDMRELTLMQALLPHFTMAVEFHFRLSAERARSTGLERLIDRLEVGAVLVDAAGTPLFVNAKAAQVAVEADGFIVDDSGIAGATAVETRRLRNAMAAVGALDGGSFDRVHDARLVLRRPSGRPPLLVTLLPIWRLGATLAGIRAPRVAVFIKEPQATPPMSVVALIEAFGLTRREAEVAVLLAQGLSPNAIAGVVGIGAPSVREYLKRAFGKTGTHGQAALVALVRGFVEPYQ